MSIECLVLRHQGIESCSPQWQEFAKRRMTSSMRRPIPVNSFFRSFRNFFHFFPFSQAASVATLPSELLYERFSLGASWVFSIQ